MQKNVFELLGNIIYLRQPLHKCLRDTGK